MGLKNFFSKADSNSFWYQKSHQKNKTESNTASRRYYYGW